MKVFTLLCWLLLAMNANAGFGGMGNVETDSESGTSSIVVALLVIGGIIWAIKTNAELSTRATRAEWRVGEVCEEMASNKKLFLAEQSKAVAIVQTLEAKLAAFEQATKLTDDHAQGLITERDYYEMIIRVLEPSFIDDLGPYEIGSAKENLM